MFSASSVGEGTGSGTKMEALEATGAAAAASSSSSGPGGGDEKWRKRRLRGGMLWMHSRQQHQQRMARDHSRVESFACNELFPNYFLVCFACMLDRV